MNNNNNNNREDKGRGDTEGNNSNNSNNNDNGHGGESCGILLKRLDDEIDSKGDRLRIGERDRLRAEGKGLLLKSYELMEVALGLALRSEDLINNRDNMAGMGYDVLEGWYKAVEDVNKRLEGVMKLTKDMEEEYKELRVRVNKFYGIEVMKDYDRDYKDIQDKLGKYFSMTDLPGDNSSSSSDKDKDDYKDGGGIGIDEKGFGFNIGDDGDGFKEGDPDWWKKE
jgi:hypothetical protein